MLWPVRAAVRLPAHRLLNILYSAQQLIISHVCYSVTIKRLTGSVEHHEDGPLLFLQQLSEVLQKERDMTKTLCYVFKVFADVLHVVCG